MESVERATLNDTCATAVVSSCQLVLGDEADALGLVRLALGAVQFGLGRREFLAGGVGVGPAVVGRLLRRRDLRARVPVEGVTCQSWLNLDSCRLFIRLVRYFQLSD